MSKSEIMIKKVLIKIQINACKLRSNKVINQKEDTQTFKPFTLFIIVVLIKFTQRLTEDTVSTTHIMF